MESVFHISSCTVDNQVKFATCTLLGAVLTWWNGHVRTLGHDAAYAMTWGTLKNKLMDKYCPKGKIEKLEIKLWNLKVSGNDVATYTLCFQELALLCTKFLANVTEKVDKYISGLLDNIHGNVMSARPKTLDEAIDLANDLMDQKLCTYAERHTERRSMLELIHCVTSARFTIMARALQKCGNHRHYKSDYPELKNRKHGNQAEGTGTRGMVYALGGEETNQDLDDIEDDINA
nr:reverse transcriptase domain-containing protein [Tanacetum cinerariifolium]